MDGIDHPALLTRLRKVRAAAIDGELDRLEREVAKLLTAFRVHIEEERATVTRPAHQASSALHRGRRQLDRTLRSLAMASAAADLRRCERISADAEALLTLQSSQAHRILTPSR